MSSRLRVLLLLPVTLITPSTQFSRQRLELAVGTSAIAAKQRPVQTVKSWWLTWLVAVCLCLLRNHKVVQALLLVGWWQASTGVANDGAGSCRQCKR
jgi:hypothetical protein